MQIRGNACITLVLFFVHNASLFSHRSKFTFEAYEKEGFDCFDETLFIMLACLVTDPSLHLRHMRRRALIVSMRLCS